MKRLNEKQFDAINEWIWKNIIWPSDKLRVNEMDSVMNEFAKTFKKEKKKEEEFSYEFGCNKYYKKGDVCVYYKNISWGVYLGIVEDIIDLKEGMYNVGFRFSSLVRGGHDLYYNFNPCEKINLDCSYEDLRPATKAEKRMFLKHILKIGDVIY